MILQLYVLKLDSAILILETQTNNQIMHRFVNDHTITGCAKTRLELHLTINRIMHRCNKDQKITEYSETRLNNT